MRKFISILFVFYVCAGSVYSQTKAAEIDIDLVIGDEIVTKEYIFTNIADVKVDKNGKIYIYDKLKPQISVFNSAGVFEETLGKKGRGPGEFLEITTFSVFENKVILYDKINQRFTEYYNNIDFKTYSISSISNLGGYFSASSIFKNEASYIIYSFDNRIHNKELKLLHKFNSSFKYSDTSFIAASSIWNLNNKFQSVQAASHSLDIVKFASDFFVAPKIYLGYIFYATKNDDGKYDIKKRESYSPPLNSYQIFPSSIEYLGIPNSTAYNGPAGKIIYQVINKSIGIHKWNNHIINFLLIDNGNELKLGFNLFDQRGNYLGYYEISNFKLNGKHIFNYKISAVDHNGYFYMIENLETPNVKRFKLKIE